MPGHGARVLPLKLVHGTQISAQAPTEGYVQTGARAREPSLDGDLETFGITLVNPMKDGGD